MKTLKTIIAVFLTLIVLGGLGLTYMLSSKDFFPGIAGKTFFGFKLEDITMIQDLNRSQDYDPATDDYDADLIRRGEEAEERSRERAQEWQEDVIDGADIRSEDE